LSGHSEQISYLAFPLNFDGVFAVCSRDEVRLWSPNNGKELLRIELMQEEGLNEVIKCNCVEFMSDGKSIVSGWTDGKIRAFLPQSGKLLWIINDGHKPGAKNSLLGGVTRIYNLDDC